MAENENKSKKDPAKAAPKAAKDDSAPAKQDKKESGGQKGQKQKKEAKGQKVEQAASVPEVKRTAPPRLKQAYHSEIVGRLMKDFGYRSVMQVPRLEKITVNMGLGEAVANPKVLDSAVDELRLITGQKPVVTRAKKAIANFKLRQGLKIGAMVTLRRERMWEFLDRLMSLALPRVRDFKGVSPRAFDGRGNFSLGIKEQIIFPEINYDKIDKIRGMNVTVVTTARTDEEGRTLLRYLGIPFRQ